VYRHYILFLCCATQLLAYLDRSVFASVLTPIKQEFGLSDTALGLLSGFAFALSYSVFGLPLGRLADRFSRKVLLSTCITLWCGFTLACGLASSAAMLMAFRLAVGAAESGASPAVVSVIADLYRNSRYRTRAMACYPLAGVLGAGIAFPLGAYLSAHYGWRMVFLMTSIPGFLFALLVALTFRAPPRGSDGATPTQQAAPTPSFAQSLRIVFATRSMFLLCWAVGLSSMLSNMMQWLTVFYQRSHGAGLASAGASIGLILTIGGPIGIYAGGWLIDRLGAGNLQRAVQALALIALAQVVTGVLMLLTPGAPLSLVFACGWSMAALAWVGPSFALSQSLVPVEVRGVSIGVMNVFFNVIGYGLSPFIVGALGDLLLDRFGVQSLRWSLTSVCVVAGLLSAALFYLAGRSARREAVASPDALV